MRGYDYIWKLWFLNHTVHKKMKKKIYSEEYKFIINRKEIKNPIQNSKYFESLFLIIYLVTQIYITDIILYFRYHYGLYQVDFSDPDRPRTPKKSVDFYRKLATTLKIPSFANKTSACWSSLLTILIIFKFI